MYVDVLLCDFEHGRLLKHNLWRPSVIVPAAAAAASDVQISAKV